MAQTEEVSQVQLEGALDQVTIDDLELLYMYELEDMPKLVHSLKARNVDKELMRRVFGDESKELKDKEQCKLHYFEFLDYCLSGDLPQVKYFLKTHEPYSVNYYYGLKKLLKF